MVRLWIATIALATAAAGSTGGCSGADKAPTRTRKSPRDIVAMAKPAIVRIATSDERVGSGFLVAADGLVATNLHVVAGSGAISVRLLDGTVLPVMRIGGVDPARDLVILDVDPPKPLPVLKLGDSAAISAGDPVLAIGNPLGVLDYTVSDGLISSIRELNDQARTTVIQISAPISQGSSGGPLFNLFGEVIGIATGIFTTGQNLNFGIPANYLKPMLATRGSLSLAEFAKLTGARPPDSKEAPKAPPRRVPQHKVSILDGCGKNDIAEIAGAITQAIELGAPLYNQGNHEACFRIYEGTVVKWEREAPCAGVRAALGDGLLRVAAAGSYTDKAWALRDTFDGLLEVFVRFAHSSP